MGADSRVQSSADATSVGPTWKSIFHGTATGASDNYKTNALFTLIKYPNTLCSGSKVDNGVSSPKGCVVLKFVAALCTMNVKSSFVDTFNVSHIVGRRRGPTAFDPIAEVIYDY